MYPPELTAPMAAELNDAGLASLSTTEQVDEVLQNQQGTTLVVVNSVCGCAAGAARPGVIDSLNASEQKPDHIYTVFAGVDTAATKKVREYLLPYPPSSPAIALFKDGQLVHMVERHHIEGRSAQMISHHLQAMYQEFC
ncbi:BrxA/BrxB family bacilliredoxin [Pontibacter sp. G13]|uniref:BrxA/BrxB family bacilliredoxin n=1 Tax=Pontibacter sp. G13 TaxID=3074898 RepID=UPI00288C3A6E|nr:BrxA/BrxB family bacilliredoxin [Pontibacter sp. G13]WNJ16687.1 BrxA/BrxB family bacilliredoxin [Pontibacter sp. G13]